MKNSHFFLIKEIEKFNNAVPALNRQIIEKSLDKKIQKNVDKSILRLIESCKKIDTIKKSPPEDAKLKKLLRNLTFQWFLKSCCIKRSFEKPRGYPGDFLIIDKIYTAKPSGKDIGLAIDSYYLRTRGCVAMRLRKEFCVKKIISIIKKIYRKKQKPVTLLDIGSGPARDVLEIFENAGTMPISAVLIDQDEQALNHSKGLLSSYLNKVEFKKTNLLRLIAGEKYNARKFGKFDIILCVGMYDYLEEKSAEKLTRSIFPMLNEGGKILIANWDISNPSRTEMEWVCDWYVFHRTKKDMLKILKAAKLPAKINLTKDYSRYFHIATLEKI